MSLKNYKLYFKRGIILAFIILVAFIYLFCNPIKEIVDLVIISFVIAYILRPLKNILQERLRINEKILSFILIILIIGIVIGCAIVIIPGLLKEVSNMGNVLDNIDDFFRGFVSKMKLSKLSFTKVIYNEVQTKVEIAMTELSQNLFDNILNMGNEILSYAVSPILIYYFLTDGDLIYNKVLLLLPTKKREITKYILKDIDNVLGRYIASQLLLCLIVGGFTFILLFILDIKFTIWLSILNAIFNIIPYFGPIFGLIPIVIISAMDSTSKCLWVVIGMVVIQQIEGNILSPKITGDSIDIHPFVIIILLILGEKLGGFVGMVIIIPVVVVLKVVYDDINYYLF